MKYLAFIITFLAIARIANAQDLKVEKVMHPLPVTITTDRTTLLVFPAPVHDGDRGSQVIAAERIPGVENVLKVKATQKDFTPSNLQVITRDGKVYHIKVSYSENPEIFTYNLKDVPPEGPVTFKGVSLNSRQIEDCAAMAIGSEPFIGGVKHRKHGMSLVLEGIFVREDVLFFRYNLKNSTQIRYDASPYRFIIRDRKRSKRTAFQERDIEAIFIQTSGSPEEQRGQTIIAAFPKFTIAENKRFVTAVYESDGDRNLECSLTQRKLLQAKTLPD